MSDRYAYICDVRFKVENYVKDSNILGVRVKATVRKDGSVISCFPAERYNKEKEEWEKTKGVLKASAASLRYPPEKGKGLTLVYPLGFGFILRLHDPQPAWEDEDVDRQ